MCTPGNRPGHCPAAAEGAVLAHDQAPMRSGLRGCVAADAESCRGKRMCRLPSSTLQHSTLAIECSTSRRPQVHAPCLLRIPALVAPPLRACVQCASSMAIVCEIAFVRSIKVVHIGKCSGSQSQLACSHHAVALTKVDQYRPYCKLYTRKPDGTRMWRRMTMIDVDVDDD
jgi:hypothetical protein